MTEPERYRVELYVQSLFPAAAHSRQEAVIGRLDDLAEREVIDEWKLVVWGARAPATPAEASTGAAEFVLNRVAVFSKWASLNGFSIEPHFEWTSVDSEFTGEQYRAVKVPIMTLAEYRNGDLTFVAPCSDGTGNHSVGDRLDAIGSRDEAASVRGTVDPLERSYAPPPTSLTLVESESENP